MTCTTDNLATGPRPRAGITLIPRLPRAALAPRPEGSIALNTNENRFGASPRVAEAIRADLEAYPVHLYPPVEAAPLNAALASLHGLGPDQVAAAGGGELLLPMALQCFAGPGDEVAYFADGFQKFPGYIHGTGATPVPAAREGDAVAQMLAVLGPLTRVVLMDNPGNPTGRMLPAEEIRRLHAALPGNVLLMLDEAYIEFADVPRIGLDLLESGNIMVFRTLSKAYGLAGLRVGWAAGAAALMETLRRLLPSFPLARASIAGALAALRDQDHLADVLIRIRTLRGEAAGRLRAAGWEVPESQGNFLLLRGGARARDPLEAARQLADAGFLVRAMQDFGGAPALRLTIGTEAETALVLEILCG